MNDDQFNALNSLDLRKLLLNLLCGVFPFTTIVFGYTTSFWITFDILIFLIVAFCYISRTVVFYKYGITFLKKKLLKLEVILFIIVYSVCFILGFFIELKKYDGGHSYSEKYQIGGIMAILMLIMDLIVTILIWFNSREIFIVLKNEIKKRNQNETLNLVEAPKSSDDNNDSQIEKEQLQKDFSISINLMKDEQFNAFYNTFFRIILCNCLCIIAPFTALIFGYVDFSGIFVAIMMSVLFLLCYIPRTIKFYKYELAFIKKKYLNLEVILLIFTYLSSFILGFFVSKNTEPGFMYSYHYPMSGTIIAFLIVIDFIVFTLIYYNTQKVHNVYLIELKKRMNKNI